MNQAKFYSSIVVNMRYNSEFFKRLAKNFPILKSVISARNINDKDLLNMNYDQLFSDCQKIIKLKQKHGVESKESIDLRHQIESLKQSLMPILIKIPNRISQDTPKEDFVVEQTKSNLCLQEPLIKYLNYIKLSYINNCFFKSIVGPNSHFHVGIGAKLQLALCEYFMKNLENENFIPISGLSLVKSTMVEAANSYDVKTFANDPCRILTGDQEFVTQHLVEASRESLLGFVTQLGHRHTKDPLRLVTAGSSYRKGNGELDAETKRI